MGVEEGKGPTVHDLVSLFQDRQAQRDILMDQIGEQQLADELAVNSYIAAAIQSGDPQLQQTFYQLFGLLLHARSEVEVDEALGQKSLGELLPDTVLPDVSGLMPLYPGETVNLPQVTSLH